VLQVPALRNVKFYTCCDEPYLDITFNITMRRKVGGTLLEKIIERLDQSHLYPNLEVPELTCPGQESNSGLASILENSHPDGLLIAIWNISI
jgi:hypothetical protein